MKPKIAIIGAGLSGIILAKNLSTKFTVTVFEKSRGIGGRMSTRYADSFFFDHGVQSFTIETESFKDFIKPYIENSSITEWTGKVININYGKNSTTRLLHNPHYVSSPNMNSFCKELAKELDIKLNIEIAQLTRKTFNVWSLKDSNGNNLGDFNWVISTAPPEQTSHLLKNFIDPDNKISNSDMKSCYALMIGFNKPLQQNWIAAKVFKSPIKWISVNSTKIGRPKNNTCFVVHSRSSWPNKQMNYKIDEVQKELVNEFEKITNINCTKADFIATHYWKYATVGKTSKSGYYFDSVYNLAATSDWCSTSSIEEVWQSAQLLSDKLVETIS